jgi:hypothetical protein
MDRTQRILEIVEKAGVLRPRDLDAHGIPRIYLSLFSTLDSGLRQHKTASEPGTIVFYHNNRATVRACTRHL